MKGEITRDGELCPACGEGQLSSHAEIETVHHHGTRGEIIVRYSTCDHCRSELIGEAESRTNKRAMALFRKSAEGLLSGAEIKKIRKKLGLTQTLAATLFGGGKVGFSRYESDDITQSAAMDSLLRLCEANLDNLLVLARQKKINLPSAVLRRIDSQFVRLNDIPTILQWMMERKPETQLIGASKPLLAANDYLFNSDQTAKAEVFNFRKTASCSRVH